MKKKALSFLLAAISAFSLVLPAFATTDTTEATVYIVDEKIRNADIQRQFDEYITELSRETSTLRSDYEYDYTTERFSSKFETRGGYTGNQPAGGVKFDEPGGDIFWVPEGGPVLDMSVSLSAPFESVTVSVDLGLRSIGATGYSQKVIDCSHRVKLWVNKTIEVQPVVTYRTNRNTGVKEVYKKTILSTDYSYELEVRIVG